MGWISGVQFLAEAMMEFLRESPGKKA